MTAFFDTNVLIYAVSNDPHRVGADRVLRDGGMICVQVLNEFANVCRRKLRLDWPPIEQALAQFREAFENTVPLTIETYAAAPALEAKCDKLYSEDLQQGRRFGELVIVNPFL